MRIQPTHIESSGPGVDLSNLPGGLAVRMSDPVEDFQYARNAVTLTYDLSVHEHVRLAFEAKEFGDEPHAPPPGPFGEDVNFDGVAVSADGVDWYEIQDLRSLRSDRFTAFDIDLDAATSQWGLEYGATFQVRFCQYDNNPAPMDGIFLHGIALTAVLAPVFHLKMDDNAADPTVHDAAPGERDQAFLDPGGNPNTVAHAVAGAVGGALAFDGIDDRIVVDLQEGLGELFEAGRDFSLAFWWKAPIMEFPEAHDAYFLSASSFAFEHIKHDTANAICFYYRRPVDVVSTKTWFDNANDGQWHHYAFVRAGSTVRLWRDGVNDFTDTHENNAASFSPDRIVLGGFSTGGNHAPGAIDDFRLYDRALTEDELIELHNLRS